MSQIFDRADKVLVALGHFESRASAQAAIAAGKVSVSGKVLKKSSEKISPEARIEAEPVHPWVSRSGLKLMHALETFEIDSSGAHCLDVGASTGGFSEVLLARGAASIIAVDVGRDQLHARLQGDPRVTSLEATDARTLTAEMVRQPPQLIVCDASFISLHKLLAVPLSLAADEATLIALFKPQFEVGREHVGKGGIVSDNAAIARAEQSFIDWLGGEGWHVKGQTDSPIKGGDGNAERLIFAARAPLT